MTRVYSARASETRAPAGRHETNQTPWGGDDVLKLSHGRTLRPAPITFPPSACPAGNPPLRVARGKSAERVARAKPAPPAFPRARHSCRAPRTATRETTRGGAVPRGVHTRMRAFSSEEGHVFSLRFASAWIRRDRGSHGISLWIPPAWVRRGRRLLICSGQGMRFRRGSRLRGSAVSGAWVRLERWVLLGWRLTTHTHTHTHTRPAGATNGRFRRICRPNRFKLHFAKPTGFQLSFGTILSRLGKTS